MTPHGLKGLESRLMHFLEDLLEPMGAANDTAGHKFMFRALLDVEHKSMEPMATSIPGTFVQALRQFVGESPWALE
jgi:SRSO17 transposase